MGRRSVADPLALRAAYRSGLVTYGRSLGTIPIIDIRAYSDGRPSGDNHLKYHSFALRERLARANGTFSNDVMLTGSLSLFATMQDYAIDKMDEWLTNVGKEAGTGAAVDKLARAKPADLVDSCYADNGERIIEPQTPDGGQCNKLYPTFSSPRMVAGGPLSNNVLKCQLKPVNVGDYQIVFSEAERKRLITIFPQGVCDWSNPGVEQQPSIPWQSY